MTFIYLPLSADCLESTQERKNNKKVKEVENKSNKKKVWINICTTQCSTKLALIPRIKGRLWNHILFPFHRNSMIRRRQQRIIRPLFLCRHANHVLCILKTKPRLFDRSFVRNNWRNYKSSECHQSTLCIMKLMQEDLWGKILNWEVYKNRPSCSKMM